MNKKVKILATLFALAFLGGVIAYTNYHKSHENIDGINAEFSLSAADLMEEFETDREAATEKYLNKLIEVSGTIESIIKAENGGHTVLFVNEGMGMGNVKAGLQGQTEKLQNLEAGESIILKGRLTGTNILEEMGISILDIELSRSVLVE